MFVNMGRVFQQAAFRFADQPAVINVERGRRFSYARMHDLTNRLSNALKHGFGLKQVDFYATILDNDNMALFHPWMLKSPVGAVWIDVRDSIAEQISRINFVGPKVAFLEVRLLPLLYEPLRNLKIILVTMDRPPKLEPGIYDFWDLVKQAAPSELRKNLLPTIHQSISVCCASPAEPPAWPNAPNTPFPTFGYGAATRHTTTKHFLSIIPGPCFFLRCIMPLPGRL
jgi:hypothetical protein